MVKQMSLKKLKTEIARERLKVRRLDERARLQKQLKDLRMAGRTDIAGRIGRGFVILGKKAGKATMKQARLIRERQLDEAKRTKKRGGGGFTGQDNIFRPLDF